MSIAVNTASRPEYHRAQGGINQWRHQTAHNKTRFQSPDTLNVRPSVNHSNSSPQHSGKFKRAVDTIIHGAPAHAFAKVYNGVHDKTKEFSHKHFQVSRQVPSQVPTTWRNPPDAPTYSNHSQEEGSWAHHKDNRVDAHNTHTSVYTQCGLPPPLFGDGR